MGSTGHDHAATAPWQVPDWLARLDTGQELHFVAGQTICLPMADDNWLFLISHGLARICLNGGSKDLTIAYLRPGSIYVSHTRAWVEALQTCTVRRWPVRSLIEEVSREPEFAIAALMEIGRVLAGAFDVIEDLAFRPVEARLARLLLSEMRAQGSARIRLMERSEGMAKALGTSRQTLSTLFNRMCHDGIIARESRDVVILCDIERLRLSQDMSSS